MQDEARAAEDSLEERGQRRGRLAELREHEHLLLFRRDDLRDLTQSGQLAAVGLAPRAIAKPLGRVITDLLEAHQRREHDAATLHPLGSLELGRQVGHRLLVESRLLACQVAKRPDLSLVRQVGDHRLVGLQAPQDVRTQKRAQRCVRVVGL